MIKGGFVPFLTTHTECQEPAHLVCRWYETTMASNSDKRCHGTLITSAQNILFPFEYLTDTVWAGKLSLLFLWEKSFSVSKWECAQLLWVLLGKRRKAESTPLQFCWDLWRYQHPFKDIASKAEQSERSRAQAYSSTSEIIVNIINLADQREKRTERAQLNSK